MTWLVTGAGVLLVGGVAVLLAGAWLERRRPREVTHCAFCKRTRHEVQRLIAAEDHTAICGDCVRLSAELLDQEQAPTPGPTPPAPGPPGDPWAPPDDHSMSSK